MRIVHYYRDIFRPSGVTRAIWGWQKAAIDAGVESIALHSGTTSQWNLPNMHVKHFGSGRQSQVPNLQGSIRQGDVLFLHEGWVSSNLIAAAQARSFGVPYFVVPHGVYEPEIRADLKQPVWLRSLFERRMLDGAAGVQVFYDSEGLYVQDLCARAKTFSVATGIDLPKPQWTGQGDYLAWFGRYSPHHKGIDRMLSAYATIPARSRIPLRLRGVDYQDGLRDVKNMIESLSLQAHVSVGGPVLGAEKTRFLLESAAFIFPSRWESQGIALLEALALGVPCIVSDSIHLAVDLGATAAAQITDFSSPEIAAQALVNTANQKQFGISARTYIAEELAWDRQFGKLIHAVSRHVE